MRNGLILFAAMTVLAACSGQPSGPDKQSAAKEAQPGAVPTAVTSAASAKQASSERASSGAASPAAAAKGDPGACMTQDGKTLVVPPLRAVGTEPFWGAKIEGRCVIYSHPDSPAGVRVWTRYTPEGRGVWSGALGGKPFELRARGAPGCSDGMSDKSYPLAVDLLVEGERRTGCAEQL